MQYTTRYDSPLGEMLLAADEKGLAGVWFCGDRYFARLLDADHVEREVEVLTQTKEWLTIYFSGKEPDFLPKMHLIGSLFQLEVWEMLLEIPYGQTTTYGEIARKIAKKRGIVRMSAQAVGGAVGHNEISILIPCHRVVGTNGNLTGYGGGLDKKCKLLEIEGMNLEKFFFQK